MPTKELSLLLITFLLSSELPISSQQSRNERQIVFPGNNNNNNNDETSTCRTPDRRPGVCVPITSCPELLRLNDYNRLRRYFCGFRRDEPKVCCPNMTPRPTPPRRRTTTRRIIPTTRPPPTRPPPTRPPPTRPPTTRPPTTQRPTLQPIRVTTTERSFGGENDVPSFLPESCGISVTPLRRVVGGTEAFKGSWPWMAVIYLERRGVKSPDCGGTLVTAQHVITAAHCVVGRRSAPLSARVLSVRLGEHDIYNDNDGMNPVDVNVVTVTRHEAFNPRNYKNDIAVLKLARPVQFNDNIKPICLPYDSLHDQDLTGKRSFVAGWGTTRFNGDSSAVLMQAGFEIQDQDFCRNAYKDDLQITEEYLCAGTADGTKDACQGDSGGPLMTIGKGRRFYLVGVVSFGKFCATVGYPGVYTRVTKYLDWLRPLLSS